ncbi:MAG: myosin heavy subunit [Bacteriovoracaceae bacterium]|jgi:myosin heavy subunit
MFFFNLVKLLLFLFIFTISNSFANTHPHGAILFHFKGDVQFKSQDNDFEKVQKEEVFVEGDILKTGENSLAIIRFSDNSTLRVLPQSEVTIESLVEPIDGNILGSTNIFLKAGQLFINVINKQEAPVFHIKTKSVAMGVRGTRFFAGIDSSTGHTELAVDKGIVEISNPKKDSLREAIEAGHGIHVEDGRFTQPQKYEWVKKLDFNTKKKTFDAQRSRLVHAKKREEFSKKRREWLRDDNKWNLHQKRWEILKKKHKERSEKFKKKREKFKKAREEFKLKKKSLIEKKNAMKSKAKSLKKEAAQLRKEEKNLRQEVSRLRSGRKDPRAKLELAKKRSTLKQNKKNLEDKKDALKSEFKKLREEKKSLMTEFKKQKAQKNNFRKRLKQDKKKLKRKARRKRFRKKKAPPRPGHNGGDGDGGGSASGGSTNGGL